MRERAKIIDSFRRSNQKSNIKLKKLKIIKALTPKSISLSDIVDSNFNSVILDTISSDVLVECFKNENCMTATLKPFMFDSLKRFHRLSKIKTSILKYLNKNQMNEQFSFLNETEERELVCALLQSVNPKSKSKLGTLISKNDYPLPLMFSKYNFADSKIELELSFDTFQEVLCLTNKPLAIVSGTKNTIFKGKSSLIPLLFNGLHEEKSIFKSKINCLSKKNNIDIICNEETSKEWVIADFHSQIETNEAKLLLKSFSAYSTLHVINVSIEDFDESGRPLDELKELLEWYKSIYVKSRIQCLIILLIRDFNSDELDLFKLINTNLPEFYVSNLIQLLKLEKIDGNDESMQIKKNNLLKDFTNILVENQSERRAMHSINDIKSFYEHLKQDPKFCRNECVKFDIERDFERLFPNSDLSLVKGIFPIAQINCQIKELQESLNKTDNDATQREENQNKLLSLKTDRSNIKQPITEHVKYFIKLVLKETFISDLTLFENCLITFKQEKLTLIRKDRQNHQINLDELDQTLKQKIALFQQQKSDPLSIEIDTLKSEISNTRLKIKELNDQIELIDLTIDKFWDEIFSTYDWILEKEKISMITGELKQNIADFKEQINPLLDRYIKLIEHGYAVHILRGIPLKLESKALEIVFDKLKSNEELFIITVIGEQSSAKSSLMNSLFGCDFRTSAGRCTIGIYMNFIIYQNKKIVILDSEGLMSIESGSNVLDNQLATMAVLSSHLIIINHKGEISTNLEKLLGITIYAKLHTSSSCFKPSILFVLRDQTNRDSSAVRSQAFRLKERLIDQVSQMQQSINDIMHIDTENMVLLPNAFSEDKHPIKNQNFKWRNDLFPEDILSLRKRLIE